MWMASHIFRAWYSYHDGYANESLELHYPMIQHLVLNNCAVPENIHTPPTEGIGISWRGGGPYETKKIKEMYGA